MSKVRLWIAIALVMFCITPTRVYAQTRVIRFPSKILGEIRVLHVNLPINYKYAKQRYPVVYVLDGQVRAFFDLAVAATEYDLIGDQRSYAMPPQIVVGVEHVDRSVDLGKNGALFTRFLVEEVVPYIEHEFRALPYRILIGHSLGGRFALQTFCRAPAFFPAVVAISASLPDSLAGEVHDCMRRDFASPSLRVQQLVLSVGDQETRMIASFDRLQRLVRDSAPPRWRALVVPGVGLTHTETPFSTIPPAMRFVFSAAVWEMSIAQSDSMSQRLGDPEALLDRHIAKTSERVGFRIAPSQKWLEVIARTALARVDVDAAIAASRQLIGLYPESISGHTLLADACVLRRDDVCARRAVNDALALLDRIDTFDESGRELQRASLRRSLATLTR